MHKLLHATFLAISLGVACAPAVAQKAPKEKAHPAMESLLAELAKHQAAEKAVKTNIKTFDTLDFDVYSNQKWDRLPESHTADILVHYPDGRTTKGLAAHIEELKPMFMFAPDTRITSHPVSFGGGEWTAAIGIVEGTFTRPMPLGGGKSAPPTNKKFKLTMVTLGHWTKEGLMDEEWLFWDNLGFMKALGLAQ